VIQKVSWVAQAKGKVKQNVTCIRAVLQPVRCRRFHPSAGWKCRGILFVVLDGERKAAGGGNPCRNDEAHAPLPSAGIPQPC